MNNTQPERPPQPGDPWARLAGAAILQALLDAQDARDPVAKMDAILWLTSPDACMFAEIAGVRDPVAVLTSGGKLTPIKDRRLKNHKPRKELIA